MVDVPCSAYKNDIVCLLNYEREANLGFFCYAIDRVWICAFESRLISLLKFIRQIIWWLCLTFQMFSEFIELLIVNVQFLWMEFETISATALLLRLRELSNLISISWIPMFSKLYSIYQSFWDFIIWVCAMKKLNPQTEWNCFILSGKSSRWKHG